jgi:hypothetical protein
MNFEQQKLFHGTMFLCGISHLRLLHDTVPVLIICFHIYADEFGEYSV